MLTQFEETHVSTEKPRSKMAVSHFGSAQKGVSVLKTYPIERGKNRVGTIDSAFEGVSGVYKRLPRYKHLFQQGEEFKGVFFVLSGALKSEYTSVLGHERITDFHFPEDLIGFDGFQSGYYPTNVVALETTSVWFVSEKYLLSKDIGHDSFYFHVMTKVSERLDRQHLLAIILSSNRATERIALFLLDLSKRSASRNLSRSEFGLPMSHTELSSYLGMTIESVSRAFTAMGTADVVRCFKHGIEILDYHALTVLAGGEISMPTPQ